MISLIVQFTKSFDFAVLYPMIDHGFYDGGYKQRARNNLAPLFKLSDRVYRNTTTGNLE